MIHHTELYAPVNGGVGGKGGFYIKEHRCILCFY